MADKTAFQALIRDISDIACYLSSHYPALPRMDSPVFSAALHESALQYLAIVLQSDLFQKQTVYRFAGENYPYSEEETRRKLYRHEKQIRKTVDAAGQAINPTGKANDTSKHLRRNNLYDPADFIAIQNRSEKASALVSSAFRGNIHIAKNFPGAAFARAFSEYDQEYLDASRLMDAQDYLAASIYFYRMEHALAFSIIANTAEYLTKHPGSSPDYNHLLPLWTDVSVPVANAPKGQLFTAWPNLLSLRQATLQILEGQEEPQLLLEVDYSSRVLKQNILELLPPVAQYGTFDPEETAAFIRAYTPVIESHIPVSFYLDDARTQIDKRKIHLARSVMRKLYTFASPPQT